MLRWSEHGRKRKDREEELNELKDVKDELNQWVH